MKDCINVSRYFLSRHFDSLRIKYLQLKRKKYGGMLNVKKKKKSEKN